MYTSENFKSKKAFKQAVAEGKAVTLFSPGIGSPKANGVNCVEGPHYPAPHSWYAEATTKDGIVIRVK